jgi:hypothetical protein
MLNTNNKTSSFANDKLAEQLRMVFAVLAFEVDTLKTGSKVNSFRYEYA